MKLIYPRMMMMTRKWTLKKRSRQFHKLRKWMFQIKCLVDLKRIMIESPFIYDNRMY